MKILRAVVILALFSSIGVSSGCGGNSNSNANVAAALNPALDNANSVKTNTEELSMLINMPYEADDVAWKQKAHNKLTAVLLFSSEKANKIAAEAAQHQPPKNVTLSSESWFPPELIAQSDVTGDDSLNGVSYAADAFFQEPYTSGRIVRIDGTDYFVLELNGK
jgi:hypothetical protein